MSKRWIQFGSAVIAMIMIANLQYAWTLFVAPMRAAHKDWSLPAIQWAFTLFIFLETWITPVEGWLIDRLGPRIFLTIGGVLVGVGWTGMGYAHSLTQLYVLYGTAGLARHLSIAARSPRPSNGFRTSAARSQVSLQQDSARARRCLSPSSPAFWPVPTISTRFSIPALHRAC